MFSVQQLVELVQWHPQAGLSEANPLKLIRLRRPALLQALRQMGHLTCLDCDELVGFGLSRIAHQYYPTASNGKTLVIGVILNLKGLMCLFFGEIVSANLACLP